MPSDDLPAVDVAEPPVDAGAVPAGPGGTQLGMLGVTLIWLVIACLLAAVLLTVLGERHIATQLQREAAHVGRVAMVAVGSDTDPASAAATLSGLKAAVPDVAGIDYEVGGVLVATVGAADVDGAFHRTVSPDGNASVDVWLTALAASTPRLWNTLAILLSLGMLFLLMSVFLVVMVGRLVGRPMRLIEARASRLAHGNTTPLPGALAGGEFGTIAASLEAIREHVAEERAAHERMGEELRRTNSLQRLMLRELNHRIRNNLASLSALVSLSRASTESVDEFAGRIERRIDAIAAVHALLSERQWTPVGIRELLHRMTPPECGERVTLSGPDVELGASQATPLAMVVQEMFANAMEHGSLASGAGWLNVQWDVAFESEGEFLVLMWRETGGPPPDPNAEAGTGTTLIRGLVEGELRGSVRLYHAPDGVSHRIRVPRTSRVHTAEV
ncbi:MAG: HWE histidine kinase domain-containing protein [Phycisphaerales bacterium]|jgi:two-component sensor histidine kinase|nr:HWE histidine kinase domain-containing protein [Phycisphaerales bacterium]